MLIEILKALLIGVIEGITEWLPISSSTHIELAAALCKTDVTTPFFRLFEVVIQLGAILAVIILYWGRLFPWAPKEKARRSRVWGLWLRIVIAAVPAAVIGFLIDDWRDEHLDRFPVKAAMLILYGALFIVIERWHAKKPAGETVPEAEDLTNPGAVKIGLFQLLSLVPGTSRSGATILGGMLTGVSRKAAAEFSFFLAIPVMLGASLLKTAKYIAEYGLAFSGTEIAVLVTGVLSAFAVSMLCLRALVGYLKTHSFEVFGWYRIVLGLLVAFLAIRGL